MKKSTTDKSAPYRTMSLEKVTAPTKVECPKAKIITSDTDLRSAKRK